ncbi:MAG: hypothetical protein ACXVCO_08625, partial [Ktedonobacterales bacterium]
PATFIKDLPHLWYSGQAWTGGFFGGYAGVLIVKRWRHITYRTGDIFALLLLQHPAPPQIHDQDPRPRRARQSRRRRPCHPGGSHVRRAG